MTALSPEVSSGQMLLGDEALAFGAIDAGISAAYAYPGTPSTEITETLIAEAERTGAFHASWCANEKTAFEAALGVSMVGGRALVSMKHVGLNVAMDPFMNAVLTGLHGGVVLAVADDPGMHSSQNEQDSRGLAEFARTICLEPATQQEAYEMAREAFELSERFKLPVVLRLVTRLCHGRAAVLRRAPRAPNATRPQRGLLPHPNGHDSLRSHAPRQSAALPVSFGSTPPENQRWARRFSGVVEQRDPKSWILLPANARRLWREVLAQEPEVLHWSGTSGFNQLHLGDDDRGLGVITTGTARNHYFENLVDLGFTPSHLHLGAYPFPAELVRSLAAKVDRLLVLEEGQPLVETRLRGLLTPSLTILGKLPGQTPDGTPLDPVLSFDGELTPGTVRQALGLAPLPTTDPAKAGALPMRPPQLCQGCPHRDAYAALGELRAKHPDLVVAGDIGCYTLGALPPYQGLDSCVCMGASVGMAKGAADAGAEHVIAVIGDSTFLHSGVTPLMDAVAADTPMTLLVLDNQTVAMTGTQPTVLSDTRFGPIITGLGVAPEHCHVVTAHPKLQHEIALLIEREVEHRGISVIVVQRECIVAAQKHKSERKAASQDHPEDQR